MTTREEINEVEREERYEEGRFGDDDGYEIIEE